MEIEGEDGTKLILKHGDKAVFGRGAGFITDDLTVSRRHVSLEFKKQPFAGGTERSESGTVSLEVLGRNPVWIRKREPGEKIRTLRKSETGEMAAGDRFCVSGRIPIWFTLKRREEATEERVSDGESGLDCIDSSDIDAVKEFGFLVIGKEFDQYPKGRIRDIKQWEWFLEDSTKGNSDDEDDDGDRKKRKGLSKKRRRKKGNEDDDWSAESEEDKELVLKSKSFKSPTYSTRSKKTKTDVNASSSSSSSRAQTKQRGRKDVEEEEDEDDDDDETLGGFIVSDEEAKLEEEDEPNSDEEEEVEDDDDEDEE